MANHDFADLYAQYPAIIAQMPSVFTAHRFILRLAQVNQSLYIDALYSYRNTVRSGGTAPFMIVHGVLSSRLNRYPHLITQQGYADSKDIFGQPNGCTQWRKL